jgi:hypothetical protein
MELLDWLCPSSINPRGDQEVLRNLTVKTTAMWIFDDESYRKWHSEPGSFLWLHGQSKVPSLPLSNFPSGCRKVCLGVKLSIVIS